MNIREFCKKIHMPEELLPAIEEWNAKAYQKELEHYFIQVQDKSGWDSALEEVKKALGEDKNGLKCLSFMLWEGLKTYLEYQERGISEQIFLDTMGCFSRFVREYHESFGCYGFDREWWTVRELTLKEFRLGELEYEMLEEEDGRFLSIHIPSDARLDKDNCKESYRKAGSFFKQFAVDYAEVEYFCHSWLLSPNLKEVLPDTSRILSFQEDFILDYFEPESNGYMQWVFKSDTLSLDEVPQTTSLQRKMKAYLQNGGKIGEARGHLKKELLQL